MKLYTIFCILLTSTVFADDSEHCFTDGCMFAKREISFSFLGEAGRRSLCDKFEGDYVRFDLSTQCEEFKK